MMNSVLVTTLLTMVTLHCTTSTPLDDYVNTPDPTYGYRYLTKYQSVGSTVHVLNMTSQTWLTTEITTNPVWWHYMCIVIPDNIQVTDHAFLFIDGFHNDPTPPTLEDEHTKWMAIMAETTGTVAAVIKQIPNEPIIFLDDPERKHRTEDAIIAWTWLKFITNTSGPEILLRLPMTKAVVRGMDTITSFTHDLIGNNISKFFIAGESKRGWTTWTTGAVDKRIVGMAPVVMDLLNLQQNLHHHYRSLGGWTFAFEDYYDVNITKYLDHPKMADLRAVVDPLTYNDRYTMPKFVVTTGGDEFFLPDDSHYYYSQLREPKYTRVIPNAEHSIDGHKVAYYLALRSFYLTILENATFPRVSWHRAQTGTGGKITLQVSRPPRTVTVYHAKTTDGKRRDFRLAIKAPDSLDPYLTLWSGSRRIQSKSPTWSMRLSWTDRK